MEFQFDNEPKRGGRPATRLYAPTHGKQRSYRPATEDERFASPQAQEQPEQEAARRPQHEVKPFARFMLILCSFIFAGMILFVLTGYERITRAYADINALNAEIDKTKLNINALEAAIECAVTIDQAQQWAKDHNMQYPSKSQYVRSGSTIPLSPTTPDTATPTGNPDANPQTPADGDTDTSEPPAEN